MDNDFVQLLNCGCVNFGSVADYLIVIVSGFSVVLTYHLIQETIKTRIQSKNSDLLNHFKSRLSEIGKEQKELEEKYDLFNKMKSDYSYFQESFNYVSSIILNGEKERYNMDNDYQQFFSKYTGMLKEYSESQRKIKKLLQSKEFEVLEEWQRDYLIDIVVDDISKGYLEFLSNTPKRTWFFEPFQHLVRHDYDYIFRSYIENPEERPIPESVYSQPKSLFLESGFLEFRDFLKSFIEKGKAS